MNWLLAIAAAVFLVLLFPGADLSILVAVALVPLLFALTRERRPLRRFLLGWITGVVYWFGVCYWIQFVLAVHGGMGQAGGWATFLLFCVLKAIHMGVFAWLAGMVLGRSYAIPAIAALWTGIERTHGNFGFAWLALGNAGIDMGVPMRLAPYAGVYALSFVFVLLNAGILSVLLRKPRVHLAWLAVLPLMYLLPALPPPDPGKESAVVVQPNVDEREEWTQKAAQDFKQRLSLLSLQSAVAPGEPRPQIVLWPEVPAPLYYDSDPVLREQVASLARLTHTSVLFGTVAHAPAGGPLNSAQLVTPDGQQAARYDKVHLVPFGEFIPPLFGFVTRITQEAGDFVPGSRVVVFPVDGHRAGAFICYESVFPHYVRQFAAAGAEVLFNLSNDGYFGRTAARRQHLKIVRMRAAENRRWIVRATNDGISAVIDPAGREVQELQPYIEAAGRVRYSYVSDVTPYTRHGDWFAWGCLLAGIAMAIASQVPVYRP